MLRWSFVCILVAIAAAVFTYGNVIKGAELSAKICMIIFSFLFVLALIVERKPK
tara:strand:- start:157 stop:318 length:162 start_codon:yes stop_codon:yes gene_type:complete